MCMIDVITINAVKSVSLWSSVDDMVRVAQSVELSPLNRTVMEFDSGDRQLSAMSSTA